jgi:type IV secretion system protein VirD4
LIVVSYTRLRAAVFAAVRMRYRYPWRPAAVGVALVLIGWAIGAMGWPATAGKVAGVGALIWLAATGWWWGRHVARPHSTKALITRRSELDQRSGGVATLLDVAEIASPKALRLQARVLRPATTAGMSWWRRWRMSPHQLGVLVAKLGWGLWGQQIWASIEDTTLRVGGPRMGKTISLAPYGRSAPGALLTTSTRLDLAQSVHGVRLRHGAVHFFNPTGLGGVPSTVRWRVLDGCEDYATADRRAADLIPPSEGDRDLWDTQARRVLALLMHAAALSGRSMRDVVAWSSGEGDQALKDVIDGLLDGGPGARDRVSAVQDFWGLNPRTKSSITSTMAIPLAWMNHDAARELGDADRGDPQLINIRELILRGQTLHLIGHEQHGTISPLIGAFVAELAHAARALAGHQPGGRLDPPLTMLLDEAAIVIPVPLHQWTADMGGSGINIHISVQSLAQTRARWGEDNADALLANVACFVVFGGSAIHDDLAKISALTGNHRMKVVGVDQHHDSVISSTPGRGIGFGRARRGDFEGGELRGQYQWVPVLSAAQIRALQPGQVLVLRRNLHAVVGWAPKHTDSRRDVVPLPRSDAEALAQLEELLAAQAAPSLALAALTRCGAVVHKLASSLSLPTGRRRGPRPTLIDLTDAEPAPRPADDERSLRGVDGGDAA